jgi:hypothetical protein
MMNSNKRKCHPKESLSERPTKEPRIGERPLVVVYLSWDQHSVILVRTLLDSDVQIWTISDAIVKRYRIPYWKRPVPLKLNNFAGESVSRDGWEYTRPLSLHHQQQYDSQSLEVSPMEPSFEMILRHWYLQVHKPSGFFDNCPMFVSECCIMNCTKEKTGQLDIEYDLNLLKTVDQEAVGFLGFVGMSSQGVELADRRSLVPERYRKFSNLFDPKGTTA